MPAVILIHFGVLVRIPGNSESEQVREAADHRKCVLEWCFGKTFRAAACPKHDTEGNAYQEKHTGELRFYLGMRD